MSAPDFGRTSALPWQWPENAWMKAKLRWLAVLAPVDPEAQSEARQASRQEEHEQPFHEDRT